MISNQCGKMQSTVGNNVPEAGLALGILNWVAEKASKQACMHFFLLLIVDAMWLAALIPCHCDVSAMMECNLEL